MNTRLVSRTFRRVSARYFVTDVRAFTHTYCHVIRADTWLLYILYKYIYMMKANSLNRATIDENNRSSTDGLLYTPVACEHDHTRMLIIL